MLKWILIIVKFSPRFMLDCKMEVFGNDYLKGFKVNGIVDTSFDPDSSYQWQTATVSLNPGDTLDFSVLNAGEALGLSLKLWMNSFMFTSDKCTSFWTWDYPEPFIYFSFNGNKFLGYTNVPGAAAIYQTTLPFPGDCIAYVKYFQQGDAIEIAISELFNPSLQFTGWEGKFPLKFKALNQKGTLKTETAVTIIKEMKYQTAKLVYTPGSEDYTDSFDYYAYNFNGNTELICTFTINICYDTCKSCTQIGSGNGHNCSACRIPLMMTSNKSDCINCTVKWYYDPFTSMDKCLIDDLCIDSYSFMVISTKECISSCAQYSLWTYKMSCYSTQDLMTELDMAYSSTSTIDWNWFKSIEETIDIIHNERLLPFLHSLNSVISRNDFSLTIIDSNVIESPSGGNLNLKIDLGDCEKILRKEYKIPDNEAIIIQVLEKVYTAKASTLHYHFFNKDYEKLNLTHCSALEYSFDLPIPSITGLNLIQAQEMFRKGINVVDPEDAFFNDLCYPYINDNGQDIILKDRRSDVFQNVTLCEPGCFLEQVDFIEEIMTCKCKIFPQLKEDPPLSFADTLPITNLLIVKCYPQLFTKELVFNFAFWVLAGVLLLFIICFCSFHFCGQFQIYSELNKYPDRITKAAKDKERNSKRHQHKKLRINVKPIHRGSKANNLKDPYAQSIILNPNQRSRDNQTSLTSQHYLYSQNRFIKARKQSYQPVAPQQYSKEKRNGQHYLKRINEFDEQNYGNAPYDSKDKFVYGKKLEVHPNEPVRKEEKSKEAIDNIIPYSLAEKIDHRNIFVVFGSILKHTLILLKPCTAESPFDLACVKSSGELLSITLSLTINALFFTDDIVSEKYQTKGEFLLVSSLLKSFYSMLLNGILASWFVSLSLYQYKLELVLKECQRPSAYIELVKGGISSTKRKVYSFFSFGIVLLLACWYYCSMFCTIYRGNQISLFIDELTSIAITSGITIGVSLVVTVLRYISLKWRLKQIYYTSNYLLRFA